jgi:hypothetical protein
MDKRTSDGKFAQANAGGPGRPKRSTEVAYIAVLHETVPLDRWRAVCESALDAAIQGDEKARPWLGKYLLPKDADVTGVQVAMSLFDLPENVQAEIATNTELRNEIALLTSQFTEIVTDFAGYLEHKAAERRTRFLRLAKDFGVDIPDEHVSDTMQD